MKKALALTLCVLMLLALPVGCGEEDEPKTAQLSTDQITSNLISNSHEYSFAHIGQINGISGLQIVEKKESSDTISIKVVGTAIAEAAKISLAADMKYVAFNNTWKLDSIKITKAVPTPTDAPTLNTVSMAVNNYISNNKTSIDQNKYIALAILGEEYHNLEIDFSKLICKLEYDAKSKTARLNVSQTTDTLTFIGYYLLTFDTKTGWVIESEKQEHGQYYLLMHLDSLEQKTTDEK